MGYEDRTPQSWPLTLLENKVTSVPTISAKVAATSIDLQCQSEAGQSYTVHFFIQIIEVD